MTRTPLGRRSVTLASVQAIASRRGVAVEVIRGEWARARAARLSDPERGPRAVSRRAFLVAGGAAAAWAALGGSRLDAAQAPPPTKKAPPRKPPATIAIVGAGMAGLTAALTLQDAGVPATVYEAAGQVGGRVHSNATDYWKDGQVSEWCGELINTDHQTMLRLAQRFGLRTLDLHASELWSLLTTPAASERPLPAPPPPSSARRGRFSRNTPRSWLVAMPSSPPSFLPNKKRRRK